MTRMLFGFVAAALVASCGAGPTGPAGQRGLTGPVGPMGPRGSDAIVETTLCTLKWEYEPVGTEPRGAILNYSMTKFDSGDVLVSLLRVHYQGEFNHRQSTTAVWPKVLVEDSELTIGDSVFTAHMEGEKAVFTKLGEESKKADCITY